MGKQKKAYLTKVLKNLSPISKLKLKKLVGIVPILSDDCIHKVCESCQNLLKNTYKFDDKTLKKIKQKLKMFKKEIRVLAKPSSSIKRKRRLLSNEQIGSGIFSILSSFILPSIIAALSKK